MVRFARPPGRAAPPAGQGQAGGSGVGPEAAPLVARPGAGFSAALAGELDRHYRDWDARGRPAVGDCQVSFLPIESECDPPPGGWQIKCRFYRELVTLGVRPEGEQGTGARTEDRSA